MFESLFNNAGLSLDRLRNFLMVVEAGSIVKAAQNDLVRQSLFSRQIRELETFFGTQLTERRGKGIIISKAGMRLGLLVREQLQSLEDFQREQAGLPKEFVFGSGASILEWVILPQLKEIAKLLGMAKLKVETHRSLSLIEAVREGRLDFAVVRENAIPEGLPRKVLTKNDYVLCIPKGLRGKLDPRTATNAAIWSKLPLALPTTGGHFHEQLQRVCAEAEIKLSVAVECHSFLQVRELVESGQYAGILPNLGTKGLESKDVMIQPFTPLKGYGRSLALHWNERQMARRGLETSDVMAIAEQLLKPSPAVG